MKLNDSISEFFLFFLKPRLESIYTLLLEASSPLPPRRDVRIIGSHACACQNVCDPTYSVKVAALSRHRSDDKHTKDLATGIACPTGAALCNSVGNGETRKETRRSVSIINLIRYIGLEVADERARGFRNFVFCYSCNWKKCK